MTEGEDYLIIPVPHDNEQGWQVELLGEFEGVEVVYGNVQLVPDPTRIRYNHAITYAPEGFEPSEEFHDYVGRVIESVVENAIRGNYLVLDEYE